MKNTMLFGFGLSFVITLSTSSCTNNSPESNNKMNQTDSMGFDQKVIKPDPIEALNNPSKHAWDLFLMLNHPAQDITKKRGEPDETKKIGDSGLVVWETWKHAGTEVFLEDGRMPPKWEDFTLDPYLNKKGKTFEASTNVLISAFNNSARSDTILIKTNLFIKSPHILFNPDDGLPENGGGETRMNKSTFDFIVNNGLFNLDGLYKFRNNYYSTPHSKRKPLAFEVESIECKAMWKEFSDVELNNGISKKYYVATDSSGKKYGLTSFHIITKEIPNWFWCSFRHKEGPAPAIPSVDTYGQPSILKGTFWENYELSGTQVDFTDSRGGPTKLSDPIIENGFEQSSCMTCHATSVVGPGVMPRDRGRLLFAQPHVFQPGKIGETIGTPKETWFADRTTGKDSLLQLDFVFSLSFRANKKK